MKQTHKAIAACAGLVALSTSVFADTPHANQTLYKVARTPILSETFDKDSARYIRHTPNASTRDVDENGLVTVNYKYYNVLLNDQNNNQITCTGLKVSFPKDLDIKLKSQSITASFILRADPNNVAGTGQLSYGGCIKYDESSQLEMRNNKVEINNNDIVDASFHVNLWEKQNTNGAPRMELEKPKPLKGLENEDCVRAGWNADLYNTLLQRDISNPLSETIVVDTLCR